MSDGEKVEPKTIDPQPPQFISEVAVRFANGEVRQFRGFGNAQIRPNMVPLNDRHDTPQPHDWMELQIVLHIEDETEVRNDNG